MFFRKKHIPILTYHNVLDNIPSTNDCPDWITTINFKLQLDFIKLHNFTPISFNQLLNKSYLLPKKPIILSFDDGYQSCYSIVYPLLKEYNFKASFFIFTDFIADSSDKRLSNAWNIGYRPKTNHLVWTEINEMSQFGLVEIGSHTKTHRALTSLSKEELIEELIGSKKIIEGKLKKKISLFSYPGGHGYDNNLIKNTIKKSGYSAAISAFPAAIEKIKPQDIFALKRIEINQSIIIDSKGKGLAKNKLITKVYLSLFFISKINSLDWLANFLIRFFHKTS